MNIVTHDIAAMLKIDLNIALKIQNILESEWFDFSQCSNASLKRNAKRVWKEMAV